MTAAHAIQDDAPEHHPGLTTVLGRLLLSLLAILAILYGSLLAIARTDGFREMMREQLAQRWGMPNLDFEQIRLDPALNMTILKLSAFETEADGPPCGLRVDSIILKIRPELRPTPRLALGSVLIEGAEIDFLLSQDGVLRPEALAPVSVLIGDLLTASSPQPDKAEMERTPRPEAEESIEMILSRRTRWQIGSSALVWRSHSGRILQRTEQVTATVSPIEISTGNATYMEMTARSRSGMRDPIRDVQIELIRLKNGQTRVIDMH